MLNRATPSGVVTDHGYILGGENALVRKSLRYLCRGYPTKDVRTADMTLWECVLGRATGLAWKES